MYVETNNIFKTGGENERKKSDLEVCLLSSHCQSDHCAGQRKSFRRELVE